MRKLSEERKPVAYRKQREKYCVADCDFLEFDHTICLIMIRGLDYLIENVSGYPPELKTLETWKNTMKKMRYAFKLHLKSLEPQILTSVKKADYDIGMKLFAKYLGALWD